MSQLTASDLTSDEIDQIKHYGILGMKWGRRKKPDGGYEPSGKRKRGERSEDRRRVDNLRENATHTLTNAELKSINERLQLEQTYSSLTNKASPSRRTFEIGKKAVGEMMSVVNTANQLYNFANSRMIQDLRGAVNDRATTAGYAAIRRQIQNNRK